MDKCCWITTVFNLNGLVKRNCSNRMCCSRLKTSADCFALFDERYSRNNLPTNDVLSNRNVLAQVCKS